MPVWSNLMLRLTVAQADLDKDITREKALAEAEGRALENRENEDVNRRSMLTRLDEERKRTIEAINTVFSNIGSGATSLLTDPVRLTTAVAGTSLLFLGIYTAREGTRVVGKAIDRCGLACLNVLPFLPQVFCRLDSFDGRQGTELLGLHCTCRLHPETPRELLSHRNFGLGMRCMEVQE